MLARPSWLLSLPGLAQTSEFYIVQDASTKRCIIVDKKPR
jgi:hypothetical protein